MNFAERVAHLGQGTPEFIEQFQRWVADPFDVNRNPNGYVNVAVAENHLLWDFTAEAAKSFDLNDAKWAHYTLSYGSLETRQLFARLFNRHIGDKQPVDAESIVVATGTSAILDHLFYTLCEPGDGVLLPAPYYRGFEFDTGTRARAKILPVYQRYENGFELNIDMIDRARQAAIKNGDRPRVLLIASPDNPLGNVFSVNFIDELVEYTRQNQLALVMDEIYANSVYGGQKFTSVLSRITKQDTHVFTVYGLAKDFGISGFKVGAMHTWNEDLLKVVHDLCFFSPVSTWTQAFLEHFLDDETIERIGHANKERLTDASSTVLSILEQLGVRFHKPQAGIFCWFDLSEKLQEQTFPAEQDFHRRMFNEVRINLSPGEAFGSADPGWFRFCFAQPRAVLDEAGARLGRFLK